MDKIADVLRKSPPNAVTIVEVETISGSSNETRQSDAGTPAGEEEVEDALSQTASADGSADTRARGKVSLSRYREASARIFAVIAGMVTNFERASIDEVSPCSSVAFDPLDFVSCLQCI
jgi:hypothetical protein